MKKLIMLAMVLGLLMIWSGVSLSAQINLVTTTLDYVPKGWKLIQVLPCRDCGSPGSYEMWFQDNIGGIHHCFWVVMENGKLLNKPILRIGEINEMPAGEKIK